MIRIMGTAHVDTIRAELGAMQQKQLPFALRWATQLVTKDSAQAVKNQMARRFAASPRGLRWLHNHVKEFTPQSTMARAAGSSGRYGIGIFPPGGSFYGVASWRRYRGSLVAMMEEGGPTPGPKRFGGQLSGAGSDLGRYAIPVRRPKDRTPIPLSMFPVNLGLSARTGITGRQVGGGLRGKRRTYLVPITNSPGNAMIFQRFGRGKGSDSMPLFWTQRETRLPARRFFFPVVQAVVETRLPYHLKRSMEHALFGRGQYRG